MQRMESVGFDESNFQIRLTVARGLLRRSRDAEPVWPVVASAAFFMVCALGFAAAASTAPGPKFALTPAKAGPSAKFTPVPEDATPAPIAAVPLPPAAPVAPPAPKMR